MKPTVRTLGFLMALALAMPVSGTADAGPAEDYANYYAALQALAREECGTASGYLEAFLKKHPDVQASYPDFYLEVRIVIGQCGGTVKVRGIEGESDGIDPLPDHPPMVE